MHSHWRKWTMTEIEAAEREPERYARELAELHAFMADAQKLADAALEVYRANAPMLHAMAEWVPAIMETSFPDALAAAAAVRTHSAKHAADGRLPKGPRKSRYAASHTDWLDVAKRAAKEANGTTAARKGIVVRALVQAVPKVTRRTLSKFVADNWVPISSASRHQTTRNMSV